MGKAQRHVNLIPSTKECANVISKLSGEATDEQLEQITEAVQKHIAVESLVPDDGATMIALRSQYEGGRGLIPIRNLSMWNTPHRNNVNQSESVECNIRPFQQIHLEDCTAGYLGTASPTGNAGDINAEAFHINFSLITNDNDGDTITTPRWPLQSESGSVLPEHRVRSEPCPPEYLIIGSLIHAADIPAAVDRINSLLTKGELKDQIITQSEVDEFMRINNAFSMDDGKNWNEKYPDLLTEKEETKAKREGGDAGVIVAMGRKLRHLRSLVIDWLVHREHYKDPPSKVTVEYVKAFLTHRPVRNFEEYPTTIVSVSSFLNRTYCRSILPWETELGFNRPCYS